MFMTKVKVACAALAVVAGLGTTGVVATRQALATEPAESFVALAQPESAGESKIDKVPEALHGFRGMVIGKLVSKDAEKGSLVLEVRKVTRVWKNNKAERPKSAEGKTLQIDDVFGKFLDVLVTLKEGDGVEVEVKHVQGDNLAFLGEWLKKVDLTAAEEKDKD